VQKDKKDPFLPTFSPEQLSRPSVYPEMGDAGAGLSDEQALKKIGRGTSTMGRVVTIGLIVGTIGLAWMYIKSSEAYDHRMDGVNAAGKFGTGSPEMMAALRAELQKTTYDDVKVRAIRNLGYFSDKESVPLLIKALDTGGIVRRAAALSLAAIGPPAADPARQKLLEVLPKTDAKDRPQVVWALAVLKENGAANAILDEFVRGLLQGQPGFDPKIVAEAVGIDRLKSKELIAHKDKPVRILVAIALSETATPEVVEPLIEMIQRPDEDAEVVRTAVAGLGRTGDPRAAKALFELMQRRRDLRNSAIEVLRKTVAGPGLAVLLGEAKEESDQLALIQMLRKTHDPRSGDALAAFSKAQNERILVEAAHGLAEIGDTRAVKPLLTLANSENESVANESIEALASLRDPSAGPALMELYEEYPYRKAAILRAIGASHYEAACPTLRKEMDGDDIGAAIKAIGELPCPEYYSTLVKMLKRPPELDFTVPSLSIEENYRNRIEVMRGLRYFGKTDPAAVKALMTIIEDPDDDFRLVDAAGVCLGQIADEKVLTAMLERIQDEGREERVRVAYAQGLWLSPDRAFAKQLFPLFNPKTLTPVKYAASLAIGYAADPDNDTNLISLLDSEENMRYAAFAIALGGGEEAAKKLAEKLKESMDLRELLRMNVLSNTDDNFNIINESMFESGQIYRRLLAARTLRDAGDEKVSHSYVWTHITTRLSSGWEGPGGALPNFIRKKLYEKLIGQDAEMRKLAADTLYAMNERGLLLAARDDGIKEARDLMLQEERGAEAGGPSGPEFD
jgi:HEAT repeat protein